MFLNMGQHNPIYQINKNPGQMSRASSRLIRWLKKYEEWMFLNMGQHNPIYQINKNPGQMSRAWSKLNRWLKKYEKWMFLNMSQHHPIYQINKNPGQMSRASSKLIRWLKKYEKWMFLNMSQHHPIYQINTNPWNKHSPYINIQMEKCNELQTLKIHCQYCTEHLCTILNINILLVAWIPYLLKQTITMLMFQRWLVMNNRQ
jgi:hypothetical protein